MPIKIHKPITPSQRGMTSSSFEEITRTEPERSLVRGSPKKAGRSLGLLATRHRGGGHKRSYRAIDFKRDKLGVPAQVDSIEYDPNRSARIALLKYADGERRYILAPLGLAVGDKVMSGPEAEIRLGNALPLAGIPVGSLIHNIELEPGRGGQLVRSAGTTAQVIAKEGDMAHIRLPSGEIRMVGCKCMATIGQLGNVEHSNIKLGKAGRARWLGRKPTVRGVVQSPRDHPHGGGEGRSPIGMSSPKSPWGWPTMGHKTRRNRRSEKMIVRHRGEE